MLTNTRGKVTSQWLIEAFRCAWQWLWHWLALLCVHRKVGTEGWLQKMTEHQRKPLPKDRERGREGKREGRRMREMPIALWSIIHSDRHEWKACLCLLYTVAGVYLTTGQMSEMKMCLVNGLIISTIMTKFLQYVVSVNILRRAVVIMIIIIVDITHSMVLFHFVSSMVCEVFCTETVLDRFAWHIFFDGSL